MKHIINKLTFDIECRNEEQAFMLRQNFTPAFNEQVAGIIDKVCSEYAADDKLIRIDKLEIDMGEFSLKAFENEFRKAFLSKFSSSVTEKIKQEPAVNITGTYLELFEFFMLKGYLPWWADDSNTDTDEISRNVFNEHLESIKGFFVRHRFNAAVWQRASFLLSTDILVSLINHIEELSTANKYLNIILDIFSARTGSIVEKHRPVFTEKLEYLRKTAFQKLVFNAPLIFKVSGNIYETHMILLHKILPDEYKWFEKQPGIKNAVTDKLKKYKKELTDREVIKTDELTVDEFSLRHINESGIIEPGLTQADPGETGESDEKLIVRHAGIILLAPYLKNYFSKTGLLENSLWINNDARYKGIILLKYLSSGIFKNYEYQLILEKILCGTTPAEPVPSDIELSDSDIEESELLLASVIENWKALRNTSVTGFRETFLKRDGIITGSGKDWLLQVERKTVDVLLESIPWGYSTIKLPWNDYLINTEW